MPERTRSIRDRLQRSALPLFLARRGLALPVEEPVVDLRLKYFQSPTFIQILRLNEHSGIHYIRPLNLASDDLTPNEKLKKMLLEPLAKQIEQDFKGRQFALQGLACSVDKEVVFPTTAEQDGNRRVIKSAQGLLNPSVREGLSRLPVYIPNTMQALADQDLPVFEFMVSSTRGARIRAIDELHSIRTERNIFPAILVIDLEKTTGYQVMQIPGGNQQVTSIGLVGDRRSRREAVLGLYVTDYPIIPSGASIRK